MISKKHNNGGNNSGKEVLFLSIQKTRHQQPGRWEEIFNCSAICLPVMRKENGPPNSMVVYSLLIRFILIAQKRLRLIFATGVAEFTRHKINGWCIFR